MSAAANASAFLRWTRYIRGAAFHLLVDARLRDLAERKSRREDERLRRRAQGAELDRASVLRALAVSPGLGDANATAPDPDPILSALTLTYDSDASGRDPLPGDPGVTLPEAGPLEPRLNLGGSTPQNFPPTTSALEDLAAALEAATSEEPPGASKPAGVPQESRACASESDCAPPSETLPEDLVLLVERLEALALLAPGARVERLPTFTEEETNRQRWEAQRDRGARKYKRPPKPLPPPGARRCRWCIDGKVKDTSIPGGETWECRSCGGTGIAYVKGAPEAEKKPPKTEKPKVVRRRKLADGTFEEVEIKK